MKTKLIIVLFFLTYQLNAQFHFKVSIDETGLYSVKLKSDIAINPGSIVGSGQIALSVPFGGFKIEELTSINGLWNNKIDYIDEWFELPLDKDYIFIRLEDGTGMADKGISIDEEITLITFRRAGECTGPLELVTSADQLIVYLDSLLAQHPNLDFNSYPNNDLTVYDTLEKVVYYTLDTYHIGQAICKPNDNPPISEEIILFNVDKRGLNEFYFNWTPVTNATSYEIKVRQKGALNWEKSLITTTPNAYLYTPIDREYEYQVIAHL